MRWCTGIFMAEKHLRRPIVEAWRYAPVLYLSFAGFSMTVWASSSCRSTDAFLTQLDGFPEEGGEGEDCLVLSNDTSNKR